MTITVMGAGSWGTALSILLARNGHELTLFGRDDEELQIMGRLRENLHYLPGFVLPESVTVTSNEHDLQPCDMWVVAVPSHAVRSVVRSVNVANGAPLVVVAAKGLEATTGKLLTDVVKEVLPNAEVGAISGPNLAVEIVRGVPTAAVAAFRDLAFAATVRIAFSCRTFRVYESADVSGVELAGALKNVLAIAAGMSDGLGFGDNSKGALLARGLKEMILLGQALDARVETFIGIAGVGDLFATAVSRLSRNYRIGRAVGEGRELQEALRELGQVAEGVSTSESAMLLSRLHQVQMPVFQAVEAVLRGRLSPLQGVSQLMERSTRDEGLWLTLPEA